MSVSYVESSAQLARDLARVLLTPPPVSTTAAELQLLAAYRDDVLNSLTALHRNLVPAATGATGRTDVSDLEREPVGTLGALLARYPRGPASDLAPSERVERVPDSSLGRAWRDAARDALLAAAAAERLTPLEDKAEATWSTVADHAAMVEAFAVADQDLHRLVAEYPGLTFPPATPGLRVTAAECGRVALNGPLAPLAEEQRPVPAPPAAVRVVSTPADLADGQVRVAVMLAREGPPTPPLLAQIAIGQARAHLAASHIVKAAAEADVADPTALTAVAAALTERAGGFTDVAAACERVRAMRAGVGARAVQQTGEVMRHLERRVDKLTPEAAVEVLPAVLAFARASGDVVTAIDDAVRRAVGSGLYLVPNTNERVDLGWVPAHLLSAPPELLNATGKTLAREPNIRDAMPTPQPPAAAAPDDAVLAAEQLRRSLDARPAGRPARPGGPVRASAPPPRQPAPVR